MDFPYLVLLAVFLIASLGLVSGCAALERRK
jgi:hypothetical protein